MQSLSPLHAKYLEVTAIAMDVKPPDQQQGSSSTGPISYGRPAPLHLSDSTSPRPSNARGSPKSSTPLKSGGGALTSFPKSSRPWSSVAPRGSLTSPSRPAEGIGTATARPQSPVASVPRQLRNDHPIILLCGDLSSSIPPSPSAMRKSPKAGTPSRAGIPGRTLDTGIRAPFGTTPPSPGLRTSSTSPRGPAGAAALHAGSLPVLKGSDGHSPTQLQPLQAPPSPGHAQPPLSPAERARAVSQMHEVQVHLAALTGLPELAQPAATSSPATPASRSKIGIQKHEDGPMSADGGPTPAQVSAMQSKLHAKFGEEAAAFLLHTLDVEPGHTLLYYVIVLQLKQLPHQLPQSLNDAYLEVFMQHWSRLRPEQASSAECLLSVLVAFLEPPLTELLRAMGLADALAWLPAWGKLCYEKAGRIHFVDPTLLAWLNDERVSGRYKVDVQKGHALLAAQLYQQLAQRGPHLLGSYGLQYIAVHLVHAGSTIQHQEQLDEVVTHPEFLQLLYASGHAEAFYTNLSRAEPKTDVAREVLRWMRHCRLPLAAHPGSIGQLAQAAPTESLMAIRLRERMLKPRPMQGAALRSSTWASGLCILQAGLGAAAKGGSGLPLPHTPKGGSAHAGQMYNAPPPTPTAAVPTTPAAGGHGQLLHGRSLVSPRTHASAPSGGGPMSQGSNTSSQQQPMQQGGAAAGTPQQPAMHMPKPPRVQADLLNPHESWPALLQSYDARAGTVSAVCFSPSGDMLAAAGSDGSITVWDPAGPGKDKLVLLGHTAAVRSVEFSPNGKHICSVSADGAVILWDPVSGLEVGRIGKPVVAAAKGSGKAKSGKTGSGKTGGSSPSRISPSCRPGSARPASGSPKRFSPSSNTSIKSSSFRNLPQSGGVSGDGTDGSASPTSASGAAPVASPSKPLSGPISQLRYSPDGQLLATLFASGAVAVWAPSTGKLLHSLTATRPAVRFVAFSPDGQDLAMAYASGSLGLWRLAHTNPPYVAVLRFAQGGEAARCVQFSPSGLMLAAVSELDPAVRLLDFATGAEKALLQGHTAPVRHVAFSPSGLTLASSSEDLTVRLWDTIKAQQWAVLRGHAFAVTACAFSPCGYWLASASNDGVVRLFDTDMARLPVALMPPVPQPAITSMTFSPHGTWLATGMADGSVWLWDATKGERILTLSGQHSQMVGCVAYSANSEFLGSASADGIICVWTADSNSGHTTARTGRLQARMQNQAGWCTLSCSIAFSSYGSLLASAHDNGCVCVWQTTTGKLLQQLKAHPRLAFVVSFSPDGQQLVSASDDGSLAFWEPLSGRSLQPVSDKQWLARRNARLQNAAEVADAAAAGVSASCPLMPTSLRKLSVVSMLSEASVWSLAGAATKCAAGEEGDEDLTLPPAALDTKPSYTPPVPIEQELRRVRAQQARLALEQRTRAAAAYAQAPAGSVLLPPRLPLDCLRAPAGNAMSGSAGFASPSSQSFGSTGGDAESVTGDATARLWLEPLVTSNYASKDAILGVGLDEEDALEDAAEAQILQTALQSYPVSASSFPAVPHSASEPTYHSSNAYGAGGSSTGLPWQGSSTSIDDGGSAQGHTDFVYAVVFSPDSRRMASMSRDGFLCMWHMRSRRVLLRVPHGHSTSRRARAKLEYAPSGKLIASSMDEDQIVKLWHVQTGACLMAFERVRLITGSAWAVVSLTPFAPALTFLPQTPEACRELLAAGGNSCNSAAARAHPAAAATGAAGAQSQVSAGSAQSKVLPPLPSPQPQLAALPGQSRFSFGTAPAGDARLGLTDPSGAPGTHTRGLPAGSSNVVIRPWPDVHVWTMLPSLQHVCLRQNSLVLTREHEIQFYRLHAGVRESLNGSQHS